MPTGPSAEETRLAPAMPAQPLPWGGDELCEWCVQAEKPVPRAAWYAQRRSSVAVCGLCVAAHVRGGGRGLSGDAARDARKRLRQMDFMDLPKDAKRRKAQAAERARADRERHEAHVASIPGGQARGQVYFRKIDVGWFSRFDPPLLPRAVRVFPNMLMEKGPGWHMPALSPKVMGPVCDGRDAAHNLENGHQGAKIYLCEEEDFIEAGRRDIWQDTRPRRYKFKKAFLQEQRRELLKLPSSDRPARLRGTHLEALLDSREAVTVNNLCLYSLFWTKHGVRLELSYQQCRSFYCMWYEYYCRRARDFGRLRALLTQGVSVEICGFDVPFTGWCAPGCLDANFIDASRPFGHEQCLAALLLDQRPWGSQSQTYVELGLFPWYVAGLEEREERGLHQMWSRPPQ